MEVDAPAAPRVGGAAYVLSTECMPAHESGVQALTALSDDVLVSGANDGTLVVWQRLPNGREFSSLHMSGGIGMVRAILPLPRCGLLPTGGFATASLDKLVRLFSFDTASRSTALVLTLSGHAGGVDALSLSAQGHLLSAGREGAVRVWDLSTGACVQVMGDHENACRVLGLANGNIVTGSAGRRNELDQHVDFKLRLWRAEPPFVPGAPPAAATKWVLERVVVDHEQAIQDLDAFPDGAFFISASNDGTVKARQVDDLNPIAAVDAGMDAEGKPVSVFRARIMPNACIVGACEDNAVRVWNTDSLVDTIPLPGTAWALRPLSNGDLAVACTQAGSGRLGHVYIFTTDATRRASEMEAARYSKDCEPPARGGAAAAAPGASGAEGFGPNGALHIAGAYETRDTVRGTAEGAYGFFRRADGATMVCSWVSAAGGSWADVGEMQDGEAGEGGAGGKWDYERGVTMDTPTGTATLQLRWNEGDDPVETAKQFCVTNGLSDDSYEEVRDFILRNMQGGGTKRSRNAAPKKAAPGAGSKHLPTKAFAEVTAVDFKKVWPKFVELNASVAAAGGTPLSAEDESAVKAVVDILENTARFHATTIPRRGAALLTGPALLTWPLSHVFPALDILRVMVSHPDGSNAALAAPTLIKSLSAIITAAAGSPEARPAALLAGRTVVNLFRHTPGRTLLLTALPHVLDAAGCLARHSHATVRGAGAYVLHNVAHLALLEQEGGGVGGAAGGGAARVLTPGAGGTMEQVTALIVAGLTALPRGCGGEEDTAFKYLVALGTLSCLDMPHTKAAGVAAAVTALGLPTSGVLGEAASDVARTLA